MTHLLHCRCEKGCKTFPDRLANDSDTATESDCCSDRWILRKAGFNDINRMVQCEIVVDQCLLTLRHNEIAVDLFQIRWRLSNGADKTGPTTSPLKYLAAL